METIDVISNLISNVGFPIVCVLIIGYLLLREQDNHKVEMNELKKSIDANTLIMAELKQILINIRESGE